MHTDFETVIPPGAKIKVIGIGGGGGNAVNTMINSGLSGVDFVAANTDIQALRKSLAPRKIQLGRELTKGLGAGSDPDLGRDAALEDRHQITEVLTGADMVFLTAGMGGGTGTGGAPIVAQIARELGALTVAVVTKPFEFEGRRRRRFADSGIDRLRESVDTLITIPNQRLLQVATEKLKMIDAFEMVDNVLLNAVKGISDIINIPGLINVDFADVKTVMASMGQALMGIGTASGENRAVHAAKEAISSPLLEDINIEGATGILINITAGKDIGLMEVNEACAIVEKAAHEDANIIFGAVIDEAMGEEIRVTVIATGFPVEAPEYFPSTHTRNSRAEHMAPKGYQNSKGRRIDYESYHSQARTEPVRPATRSSLGDLGPSVPIITKGSDAIRTPEPEINVDDRREAEALTQWTFRSSLEDNRNVSIDDAAPKGPAIDLPEPSKSWDEKHPQKLSQDIDKDIDEVLSMRFDRDDAKTREGSRFDVPAYLRNGKEELPVR